MLIYFIFLERPRSPWEVHVGNLWYSLSYTKAIWYSVLLLGYKPVQHVIVLNTEGNCNTMVSIVI